MDSPATPSSPVVDLQRSRCERIGNEISELCAYIYAAEHHLLTLIREFDEHKGWEHLGFPNCASWLNFKCGIDMNTARERVRVAHALAKLPKVDKHFAGGAISYSKVRAISRVADATNEDYFLMIARHGTAYHVEKLVRKFRQAARLQDTGEDADRRPKRQLSYHYDSDGELVIKGRFPVEQGALVVKALEMALEKNYGEQQEAVDREASTDEPIAARRADALVEVAETYMNSEPVPNATADRYQVVVHVNADAATSQAAPARAPHIEDGPDVSAETSRRIACDCSLLRVDEDQNGEPLSIGRKTRSIPPAIRRALRLRDSGCRFPGCTHDRFVDGHHIVHWADGGETSLENLVLLCRHHHHLVHEGGFACEKSGDGEIYFRDPRDVVLKTFVEPRTLDQADLDAWLDRQFFDMSIDADTCKTQWHAGERMDWDLAVSNLFLPPDVSAETSSDRFHR
ncbi:MAG: DUF222 domain-containing protein [Woeseiaceae bacterium]|nr:DUF222 domain-containing protein [Woeseiaceae bacterium]